MGLLLIFKYKNNVFKVILMIFHKIYSKILKYWDTNINDILRRMRFSDTKFACMKNKN